MRLGICLSGGGIKGFSHIGALRALRDNGIKITALSGASAGAIIAGLYSTGMSLESIAKLAVDNAKNMMDINYSGIAKALITAPLTKELRIDGLVKGNRFEKVLDQATHGKMMFDCPIPVMLMGTNINDGNTLIFTNMVKTDISDKHTRIIPVVKVSEAIRASMSVPGIFKPKRIGEYLVVDGGVKNNTPFDVLLQSKMVDKVLTFNLGYNGELNSDVDSIPEILSQMTSIFGYSTLQLQKKMYNIKECEDNTCELGEETDNKQVLILNPHIYNISILETDRVQESIDRGYTFVSKNIDTIKKFLEI